MTVFVVHGRRVFLISTRHIKRIRGAFCDDALYKLTFTLHYIYIACAANLDRLQRVQDVLARVVAQAPWSVSSTDLLRDFHWLPIRQRIVYKQCLMTYKAVHIGQPNYLNELVQPYQPVRTLRSSTSALLVIPFVGSDFASDAFSVSAPTLWNNLPQDVRSCANQATFKSRLKSHLFSLAFTI